MKKNIHPEVQKIKVQCSCGNSFETDSVLCKDLRIEICNKCHPFFTGKQRIIDAEQRVASFNKRFGVVEKETKKD